MKLTELVFARRVALAAFFVFLVAPYLAVAQITLRTADTILRLEASPHAPRVVELQTSDGSIWKNRAPDEMPDFVEFNGKRVPLQWKFQPQATQPPPGTASFIYVCSSPRLRLTWQWRARASDGPIEHVIRIENLDAQQMWLPLIDSFRFDWQIEPAESLEQLFIEKGSGTPSPTGTHRVSVSSGHRWEGSSSTYDYSEPPAPREIIPWMLVQRTAGSQSGWYVGIESSARTHLTLARAGSSLTGAVGLNPNPAPFRTLLSPGGSFSTPVIFLGGAVGGPDAAGNILRRWERTTLTNARTWKNPHYPTLTINSWGSGMQVDEALALRMLRDSADLKFEMFHIDAGWFRSVGDWYPDPKKFPRGLAPIADEAHRLGLKFGLWVDWAQAGVSKQTGALNVYNPNVRDWLVADLPPGWKPEEFKGQTIDLGVPAAKEWAQSEVERIVRDYHLDMLEHDGYLVAQGCSKSDHPHAAPDPANLRSVPIASWYMIESSNSTDVSHRAVDAYYSIYSSLRQNHPDLLLEVCNDGGRMVDFGSAAHADYFSITDTYDPLSNRRAFYDASHVLPPAMLESYVEKWPTPRIENFRYMLRSGMMGWLSVMTDTTAWSNEQHDVAQQEFALYKSTLRPFIREADLYHIGPRPDGIHWDAVEYFDPVRGAGVIYAFRGSDPGDSTHVFVLQGLRPDRSYTVQFHNGTDPDRIASGMELLQDGLKLALPFPLSSALVFISELPR